MNHLITITQNIWAFIWITANFQERTKTWNTGLFRIGIWKMNHEECLQKVINDYITVLRANLTIRMSSTKSILARLNFIWYKCTYYVRMKHNSSMNRNCTKRNLEIIQDKTYHPLHKWKLFAIKSNCGTNNIEGWH